MRAGLIKNLGRQILCALLCSLTVVMSGGFEDSLHSWIHQIANSDCAVKTSSAPHRSYDVAGGETVNRSCALRVLLATTLGSPLNSEKPPSVIGDHVGNITTYEAMTEAKWSSLVFHWRAARGPPLAS